MPLPQICSRFTLNEQTSMLLQGFPKKNSLAATELEGYWQSMYKETDLNAVEARISSIQFRPNASAKDQGMVP